jgi:tetratricopeptide (TPR) repeat protein
VAGRRPGRLHVLRAGADRRRGGDQGPRVHERDRRDGSVLNSSDPARRSRLARKLLLAFVGAPALVAALLALTELAFVVAGSDPRRHYFERQDGPDGTTWVASTEHLVANTRFRVEKFAARPPAGTRRIVCIGDSTCFGFPFDPPVPFYCWLEARLKQLLPQDATEVVNLASIGFCSEDVMDVLDETEGAGADVLVVYVGHNEFLDRNLRPLVQPLAHVVRRALAPTRLGTWLIDLLGRPPDVAMAPAGDKAGTVRPRPLFSAEQLARGHARYREHLATIVAHARARGTTVVLVHPVCDYVDQQVMASAFAESTSQPARDDFLAKLQQLNALRHELSVARSAGAAADLQKVATALALVDALAAIDPTVALLPHERGRLLFLSGKMEDARRELAAAVEADANPLRSTRAIHAALDEVAHATGALTVDPRPAFDAAAAPGLPGSDGWFVDYCHPDLKGHELIADLLLHTFAQAGLLAPAERWRFGAEPSPEEYLKRGGYDAAGKAESWAKGALFRIGASQFGAADEQELEVARLVFERALKLDARCASAWVGLGVVATSRRDAAAALASFDRAAALAPAAIDPIAAAFKKNPAVKSLFERAGLTLRGRRVVRMHG